MILHWPQITIGLLMLLGFVDDVISDDRKADRLARIVTRLLAIAVLYFGGFWTGVTP
jgi:hypothetical protein